MEASCHANCADYLRSACLHHLGRQDDWQAWVLRNTNGVESASESAAVEKTMETASGEIALEAKEVLGTFALPVAANRVLETSVSGIAGEIEAYGMHSQKTRGLQDLWC